MTLDDHVERLGRWTAGRSSRRSFLGRAGRVAVLVASGPSLAVLLSQHERAEARVCGQSGVAPTCDTFDCDQSTTIGGAPTDQPVEWGWCWYASGCCAEGALKKICDCCAAESPQPRGYCPTGTRVYCIVESCGADPRLQTRTLHEVGADPVAAAIATARVRFPEGAPEAVVGDAEDPLAGAVGAALVRVVGGPFLANGRLGLDGRVLDELGRLGVEFVKVVGAMAPTVDAALIAEGFTVERISSSPEPATLAADVAAWSRPLTGARRALVLADDAAAAAAPAAALAGASLMPLLIGTGDATRRALADPRPVRTTFVVTADPAAGADLPGAQAVVAQDATGWADALADLGFDGFGIDTAGVAMAPLDDELLAVAVAGAGGAVLRYEPGTIDGARSSLFAHRDSLADVVVAGPALDAGRRYELQSIVNAYDAHLLQGEAGEGLPVIPQPESERCIGCARQ